ncbi:MAG: choice-of-anchor D domain-containing protein [Flavobacteriales bacterium]
MAQHIPSFCLSTLLMATTLHAQSDLTVAIQQETAGYDATLNVDVTLTSDQAVSAGQWDLHYDAEKLDFASLLGSPELPSGLQAMVQPMEAGVLRVVLFSLTNDAALPGTGGWTWSLTFETKYTHGDVPFSLEDGLIVGEDGSTLELTTTDDEAVVVGPKFHLATATLPFGDVPMLSEATMSLEVVNEGNAPLTLESLNLETPFTLVNALPVVVDAEGSTTLTVAVSTASKTNASATFTVVSDDPAPLRTDQSFDASVNVFAVNELHLGGENVVLGEPFEVTLAANNMEPFSAFQLDVVLPEGVSLVADSEVWSGREADHMLAFSQVGPNTVRLLGFSPSNTEFTGDNGALCAFQLVSNEAANTVTLGVDNGLMSNVALGDVMSAAYGVTLSQAYPAVQVPAVVALGVVPVAEPQSVSFTVTNQGGALLVLQDLQVQSEDVEVLTTLPLELDPGESAAMELVLTPSATGEVAIELALTHNAEGGFTPVALSADVIQPNYLLFENDYAPLGGTWSSAIRLVNTEPLKGMQFDVGLPEGIVAGSPDFGLLLDDPSFQLSVSSLGANVFRLLVFNLTGASVPAGNQALVSCSGGVDVDMEVTTYPLPLSGVVLSNASNQNVASVALEEGFLTVSCAEDLDGDGVCDGCVGDVDECGVCAGPGAIFECGCAELPTGACDCDGNELDALGVCGGACAQDLDQDGICDDVDECVGTLDACGICNGPGEIFDCGCTHIPSGSCDCDGNELDALGVCGGACAQDLDQDGICDDVDECVGTLDACGICNGPGYIYECGCANIPAGDCDCDGNQLDALGVCGGACTVDADGDGICDDTDDCVGTLDACGICNGPGDIYECGCANIPAGDCDCDGNQLDALGVCGGVCAQDLDQDGICDDIDECVGTLDACGICNGPGYIYECGCANIPVGDCDCDGNQLDALDICGGDCSEDEDHDGVCDDADDCVGEVDACGVCNGPGEVYDCGCFDIPEGDCDCDGTQPDSFGVCGGACAADFDEDGEVGSSDLLFFLTQFGAACL